MDTRAGMPACLFGGNSRGFGKGKSTGGVGMGGGRKLWLWEVRGGGGTVGVGVAMAQMVFETPPPGWCGLTTSVPPFLQRLPEAAAYRFYRTCSRITLRTPCPSLGG